MAEGMRRVRDQLGDDAVIVQSEETDGGVLITAAVDTERGTASHPAGRPPAAVASAPWTEPAADTAETISEALSHHRVPPATIAGLLAAGETWDYDEPAAALAGALAARFAFRPVEVEHAARPLLLTGPAGAGKTVTVAKLGTVSALAGGHPCMICADTDRAGGFDQLAAFARALNVGLLRGGTAAELRHAVRAARGPILIDGPACDPFCPADTEPLRELIAAAAAEPLVVLPAGIDAEEAGELAAAYGRLGATRFIATRLDSARRLGGILAAGAAGLAFAGFGVSRRIVDGLRPSSPAVLAEMLLNGIANNMGFYGTEGSPRVVT